MRGPRQIHPSAGQQAGIGAWSGLGDLGTLGAKVIGCDLKFVSIRVGEVDRVRYLVILKLEGYAVSTKVLLRPLEVGAGRGAKRQMIEPDVGGVSSVPLAWEQGEKSRAQAQEDRYTVPLTRKHMLATEDPDIPGHRFLGRSTSEGKVVDLL
jgi:hypothetical protein